MSFTVACKGVAKAVLIVALCGVPPVGAMLAGEPALTRIFVLVPVIVAFVVSVAAIFWFPAVFSVAENVPVPLVRVVFAGNTA
jgi:hypothetical protein